MSCTRCRLEYAKRLLSVRKTNAGNAYKENTEICVCVGGGGNRSSFEITETLIENVPKVIKRSGENVDYRTVGCKLHIRRRRQSGPLSDLNEARNA